MGFRTWQCGGSIEVVPCSRVGHVFRTGKYLSDCYHGPPYLSTNDEAIRNKLRTAEIWMDEYKSVARGISLPLPPKLSLEPLEPRRALREKLACKSFGWYLKHVATDIRAPVVSEGMRFGALRNPDTNACLDTMGALPEEGTVMRASICHGQHLSQALRMTKEGHIFIGVHDLCVVAWWGRVVLADCGADARVGGSSWWRPWLGLYDKRWRWSPAGDFLSPLGAWEECLAVSQGAEAKSSFDVAIRPCKDVGSQAWVWVSDF